MMRDGWIMPGRLRHVVIDEADEMLSRGFEKEVAEVIDIAYQGDGVNRFGARVQFCFAAATMREEGPIFDAFARGARIRCDGSAPNNSEASTRSCSSASGKFAGTTSARRRSCSRSRMRSDIRLWCS